jgi:hypothetical protein
MLAGGGGVLNDREVTVLGEYATAGTIGVNGRTVDGDEWSAILGGPRADSVSPWYLEARHSQDGGGTSGWRWTWSNVRKAYEWAKAGMLPALSMTSTGYDSHGYEGANLIVMAQGLIIGGPKHARIRATHSTAQITGEVVAGEVWILTGAGADGPHFAKCTKSGVVGVNAVVVSI